MRAKGRSAVRPEYFCSRRRFRGGARVHGVASGADTSAAMSSMPCARTKAGDKRAATYGVTKLLSENRRTAMLNALVWVIARWRDRASVRRRRARLEQIVARTRGQAR